MSSTTTGVSGFVGSDSAWTHLGFGKWAPAVLVPKAQELGLSIWAVNFHDRAPGDLLAAQGNNYHVVEFGPGDHEAVTRITALNGVLHAPSQRENVTSQIASSDLITLTVTPNGYALDGDTIRYLVDGLRKRFGMQLPPPVVMSCDNTRSIPNGDRLRNAVDTYVGATLISSDRRFISWLREVAFVNTVVDRIVTSPTDEQIAWMAAYGGDLAEDLRPIVTEKLPPLHWIIEMPPDVYDHHLIIKSVANTEIPALIVDDIGPWSNAKSWMLNGTHALVGMAGLLRNHEYAHTTLEDRFIRDMVVAFLTETIPAVGDLGEDLATYAQSIIERVANENLPDLLTRLTLDIFGKATRLLDPLLALHEQGTTSPGRALALATWAAYVDQVRSGELTVQDTDGPTRNHVLMTGRLDMLDPATLVSVLQHAGGYRFSAEQRDRLLSDLTLGLELLPGALGRPDLATEPTLPGSVGRHGLVTPVLSM